MRYWLDRLVADQVLEAAVVYGYFPCYSEGNTLVVLDENASAERARFTFPRQRTERRLCIADFFRPRSSGELDVIAMQLVTVGQPVSEYAEKLRAAHAYRDYFEVHGLSVQLAEALAEYWHRRIRSELVLPVGRVAGRRSTRRTWPASSPPTTAAAGTRSATRPAPTWRTARRSPRMLEPERIGVVLSEEFQLDPEQSTDAIVVHHPEASTSTPNDP